MSIAGSVVGVVVVGVVVVIGVGVAGVVGIITRVGVPRLIVSPAVFSSMVSVLMSESLLLFSSSMSSLFLVLLESLV